MYVKQELAIPVDSEDNRPASQGTVWSEENKEGITALNEFVEQNGTFSKFQRTF